MYIHCIFFHLCPLLAFLFHISHLFKCGIFGLFLLCLCNSANFVYLTFSAQYLSSGCCHCLGPKTLLMLVLNLADPSWKPPIWLVLIEPVRGWPDKSASSENKKRQEFHFVVTSLSIFTWKWVDINTLAPKQGFVVRKETPVRSFALNLAADLCNSKCCTVCL